MQASDFKKGDRVQYHLQQGADERWLDATVIGGGSKRVVITTDGYPYRRVVKPDKLRFIVPVLPDPSAPEPELGEG